MTFMQWLKDRQYSAIYIENLRYYAVQLEGNLSVGGGLAISQKRFDTFLRKYPNHMARTTARLFLEWLRETGEEVPAIQFPKVRGRKGRKLIKYLTKEEIDSVINHVFEDGTRHGIRDRLVFSLLFDTGMRASDAAGLKWGQINFQKREIRGMGKGRVEYIVPFGQRTALFFLNYKKLSDSIPGGKVYVFPNGQIENERKHIHRKYIWEIVVNMCERSGLSQRVHPHMMRHSIATAIHHAGGDITEIAAYLRHKDPRTALIYTHTNRDAVMGYWKKATGD